MSAPRNTSPIGEPNAEYFLSLHIRPCFAVSDVGEREVNLLMSLLDEIVQEMRDETEPNS